MSLWFSIESLEGQMGSSNPTCLTPKLGLPYASPLTVYFTLFVQVSLGCGEIEDAKEVSFFLFFFLFPRCSHPPPHSGLPFNHPTKKLLSSVRRSSNSPSTLILRRTHLLIHIYLKLLQQVFEEDKGGTPAPTTNIQRLFLRAT